MTLEVINIIIRGKYYLTNLSLNLQNNTDICMYERYKYTDRGLLSSHLHLTAGEQT